MRAYRVANREKVRAYNDDYAAKNPLVRIQIKQRYWARRKALPCERIDVAMFEAKLADYGFLCAYCQDRPYEHWDHVVPISKGGPHALSNLVPSCAHCNHTKWAHLWPAPAPPVMIASPS
jgi:5-methylcytosine-specific restriction endonuclease McrA